MTYRSIDTATWRDPFFENLRPYAKLLFIHAWTNDVCNPAGLYEMSKRRIEFEVGFSIDDVVQELTPKVVIDLEKNIVWVKNFFRRQCVSAQFAKAAVKAVQNTDEKYKRFFYEYNAETLKKFEIRVKSAESDRVSIGYGEGINTLSPTGSGSGSVTEGLERTASSDADFFEKTDKTKKTNKTAETEKTKKTGNFEKKVGGYLNAIVEKCETIFKCENPNGKDFNPYQFVQAAANKSKHPQSIVDALDQIIKNGKLIKNKWTYGNKIVDVNSGNYLERENAVESERFKNEWCANESVLKLVRGIGS